MDWSAVRQRDYRRLIDQQHVYVDYTGGGQCPESLLQQYHDVLLHTVFGNPHSNNPTSAHTTELIETTRRQILDFFHAGDEYDLIFTPNASGALKIFGESYPWSPDTVYILARDNHNSVSGTREFAKRAGATIQYWDLTPELRLQDNLEELLQRHHHKQLVVAFPAQSNFSGVMHPLSAVDLAQRYGATVVLDVAAFVPTHPLDLRVVHPDALCLSFYKILGFPTGIGGLIIRKSLLPKLRKAWFAGGTVRGVSFDDYMLEPNFSSFEDGTINYALIPALQLMLEYIAQLGGMRVIEERVNSLTHRALAQLSQLPEIMIYGPRTLDRRGATLAVNVLDAQQQPIHYSIVERLARERNISLRGGCFCNPGASTRAFGFDDLALQRLLTVLHTQTREQAKVPGAIRLSFGLANNEADIDQTVDFLRSVAKVQ